MASIKRIITSAVAIVLLCVMVINMTGCAETIEASDLMENVEKENVTGKAVDKEFVNSQTNFYIELFKNSFAESGKENVLVSPLSVMLALSMAANGADGDTKEEMENVLSDGLAVEEIDEYLYSYVEGLKSKEEKQLYIANSIWVRDDLNVENDFLQTNANYFGASVFKTPFNDQCIKDINNWVKENTDEMIDKIMDSHTTDAVMYLINAVTFDAEWEEKYESTDIIDGKFLSYNYANKSVEMMLSKENEYLEDEDTIGFVKPYKNNEYSFVALLPDEDVDILDYIEEFTYDKYANLMENSKAYEVNATIPKFSYEYETSLKGILMSMGMEKSFNPDIADFTKLGNSSKKDANIYIGDVIHKTFIEVDENGTKAAAITNVIMEEKCAASEAKSVKLNRPFVYMIVDNTTNLPIFMGVVMDI